MTRLPRLLDDGMKERCRLHPDRLRLMLNLTPLSTAMLVLPPGEPKLLPGDFAELYGPEASAGIFRVTGTETDAAGRQTVYLEHGMGTLGDHVVFEERAYQGLDTGGDTGAVVMYGVVRSKHANIRTGKGTGTVLATADRDDTVGITGTSGGWYSVDYGSVHGWVARQCILNTEEPVLSLPAVVLDLLDTQQPEAARRWTLGDCAEIGHCGMTLKQINTLRALLSLPSCAKQACRWTFDQTVYPWRLGLALLPEEPSCELRLRRNLRGVRVTRDRDELCTRLWPVGHDGLTIADVNDGAAYLTADTAETWGIAERIYAEEDEQNAAALMQKAQHQLERLCEPSVTVEADALALYAETGERLDLLEPGSLCRVALPELGVSMEQRVIRTAWEDVLHRPAEVKVTLASGGVTASGILSKAVNAGWRIV